MISRLSRRFLAAGVAASLLVLPAAALRADSPSFKTLHTFDPANEGNVTYSSLVQGADGRFYGVNSASGKNSTGTVFSLKNDGTGFFILSSFPDTNGGAQGRGALAQARDGNFYGTTYGGGTNGVGTLYQVTPGGTLTYLSDFDNGGSPGANPTGTLVEGLDGYLYGTAQYGGTDNFGTVYRATVPAGVATTFATITGGLAGEYPTADLIQAHDGAFYGTTNNGGANSNGTFFRVTAAGVFTTLYSFTGSADGGAPLRGVVQGNDNAFYGATQTGGTYASGAIFRLVVSGDTATVTVLHDFAPSTGEGMTPDGALALASDGNLYGTTAFGGSVNGNTSNLGTVYKITPTGGFTQIYSFAGGTDGGNPAGGLVQGNDGKLYGTTAGQNGAAGTVFKIDLGLPVPPPAPLAALVTTAATGEKVYVKGAHFVGTTAVNFTGPNGTLVPAAGFTVESGTIIAATVPAGAVTGLISVTANNLTAATAFPLNITDSTPPPPPVVVPSVSLSVRQATAAEGGASAKIKIARSGTDYSAALTVRFKIQGSSTAGRGVDYTLVSDGVTLDGSANTVTIPVGAKAVTLKVVPIDDAIPEPPETVKIKLKTGDGYTLDATAFKGVVTILDNDSNN